MPKELILKQFDSEVKIVEGERALNVTITTNDVDRSGDIVEPKGAKLTNFKKNPVVLMAHDYQGLPIGKASDLTKTDNGITAKVTFPEEGTYPLADTVYNLYKQKFMKAWSIGFIPIKSENIVDDEDKDSKTVSYGKRFKTWELLEFSACAVPANPHALTNMLRKGIDVEPLKEAGFIEIVETELTEEGEKKIKEALKDVEEGKVEEVTDEDIDKEEKKLKEIGLFDIKELTEIVNRNKELIEENKELKEKLEAVELKAGAVLNAKNKSNLKKAQDLIQSVLDSAGTTEEDSGKVVNDDNKNNKGDDNVIDIVTDTVDDIVIDEEKEEAKKEAEFQAKIEAIINQSMEENKKYFKDNLNYVLGRIKK